MFAWICENRHHYQCFNMPENQNSGAVISCPTNLKFEKLSHWQYGVFSLHARRFSNTMKYIETPPMFSSTFWVGWQEAYVSAGAQFRFCSLPVHDDPGDDGRQILGDLQVSRLAAHSSAYSFLPVMSKTSHDLRMSFCTRSRGSKTPVQNAYPPEACRACFTLKKHIVQWHDAVQTTEKRLNHGYRM